MISLPENVRQDLVTLLPASLINEVTCFVFYDNHPRDQKNIDVTVCTLRGELKEFYKRDLIDSTIINSNWKPQNIRILRNNKCQLVYLVSYEDEIVLMSGTNKLQVLHKINNIDTYEIEDSICRGQAHLKIICKDDAVPLFFDANFEKIGDRSEMFSKDNRDDSLPIITQLARKLTEVKYSVKCNEIVLKDLTNLRQVAAYSDYKKCSPRDDDAVFIDQKADTSGPLKLRSQMPVVLIYNKKITITLEVQNKGTLSAENINILLHSFQTSTVYTTKVFAKITSRPPYWIERLSNTITKYNEYNLIVAIIDLEELKYKITSKINLRGVVTYQMDSKEYLLPFKDINLSSLDTMGEHFDVLSAIPDNDNIYDIVALLATSKKTDLCLRIIKLENEEGERLELLEMFSKHLNMQRISTMSNISFHKCSPYHILYGVMVVEKEFIGENKWIISLHTRSQDQILAFIHYMHDAIPYRIVTTTINQKITSKIPELAKYDEATSESPINMNYSRLKLSMLKQTSMTLQYLDECMIKMNESRNPIVQSKVGREIDIFAGDESRFQEFRNMILSEAAAGIGSICEETCGEASEGMDID